MTSPEEVVANVERFHNELERAGNDLRTQLKMFEHWYFVPHLGKLGPSKFVGYRNMTGLAYQRGFGKDGGQTQKALAPLSRKLTPEDPLYRRALQSYDAILTANGKERRAVYEFYALR